MSDKLTKEDARELIRVMHADQGLHQPAFSQEFANKVIDTLNSWFNPASYHSTLWLERWEEDSAPAVRLEAASPPPSMDDDIPLLKET